MSAPSGGPSFGPLLVLLGIAVVLVGILAWTGAFRWFGHLPGDVHVEREGFQLWVPITSMLLVSVVLSVLLWVLRRLF